MTKKVLIIQEKQYQHTFNKKEKLSKELLRFPFLQKRFFTKAKHTTQSKAKTSLQYAFRQQMPTAAMCC